jgi:hypothetical protein
MTRSQPGAPSLQLPELGWEHISFTGDYIWDTREQFAAGRLRPSTEENFTAGSVSHDSLMTE